MTDRPFAGRWTYGLIGGLYLLWALSAVVGLEMPGGLAAVTLAPVVVPLAQLVRPTRLGWWLMLALLAGAAVWTLVSTVRGIWYMTHVAHGTPWRWYEDGAFHALLIIETFLGVSIYRVWRLGRGTSPALR